MDLIPSFAPASTPDPSLLLMQTLGCSSDAPGMQVAEFLLSAWEICREFMVPGFGTSQEAFYEHVTYIR